MEVNTTALAHSSSARYTALTVDFLVAALPTFLASVVEFVEAFTIVLAIGLTRGWRAPLIGVVAAMATLGTLIAVFGSSLGSRVDQHLFELTIGVLLLLFGTRWLRKAILRSAGMIALHDEDLVYRRQLADLRARGERPARFDWIGFVTSYKAMFLEGLEVAFIVITVGATREGGTAAASVGAGAAFVVVAVLGAAVRAPLTRVPENLLKFTVGIMLCTFGVYWAAEGMQVEWAGGPWALLGLAAAFTAVSAGAVRALKPAASSTGGPTSGPATGGPSLREAV